jgi:hypothetical protein
VLDDVHQGQSSVEAMQVLLQKGPVVMLFDSVEAASADQLSGIEALLGDLIDDEKLFVVLASKKILLFQRARSVARKLTTLPLQPLDRETCNIYLTHLNNQLDSEVRDLLFEWTRGYPLAMSVLVQAINDGLDIRTEEGKQAALALFKERLIDQEVLSHVRPEDRAMYFSILQLFAVPRRFNLVLMQDLIERFLPSWRRNSSLAYFGLPREIGEATTVLSWNMQRAGFCIDTPIRNIFLLLLKTEQPALYGDIHHFLVQINMQRAREVSGSDCVRYVRECLYHIACDVSVDQKEELLLEALRIAFQGTLETVLHFSEEFSLDEELKEVLGSHLALIQSTIDAYLAEMKSKTSEDDVSEG